MFSKMKKCIIAVLSALLLVPAGLSAQSVKELFAPACDSIKNYLAPLAEVGGKIVVDKANTDDGSLNLTFKSSLAEYPLRDETVNDIYAIVRKFLPAKYSSYKKKIKISCGGVAIEDLKTNIYSADPSTARVKEHSKLVEQHHKKLSAPLVTDLSKPYELTSGLEGRHIAIWQSHGYYYEQKLKRWEWQRARIFETVEDLYTQSYVLPFLVPMLENAGANVLLPRERDWNCNEVIVDNDTPGSGYSETGAWSSTAVAGFANPSSCYVDGENPFMMGTARKTDSGKRSSAKNVPGTAKWIPNIPETGEYAVYVSYQTLSNSTDAAPYEVRHKGGVTSFKVNQQMGGGTWIYLGRFLFEKEVVERRAEGPLTAAQLCEIMLEAQRQTYGDGLDPNAMHPYMWACKPHYYSAGLDFYNFPYAFGLLFGKGIFAIYQKKGKEFLPLYDELLRSTGAGNVREVAATVGIDVADVAFWRESLRVVLEGVDEMAALV